MRKIKKIILSSPRFSQRVLNDVVHNPYSLDTDHTDDRIKFLLDDMIGELQEQYGDISFHNISEIITELGYPEIDQEILERQMIEEQLSIEAR